MELVLPSIGVAAAILRKRAGGRQLTVGKSQKKDGGVFELKDSAVESTRLAVN